MILLDFKNISYIELTSLFQIRFVINLGWRAFEDDVLNEYAFPTTLI